jgi:hypothetical protein
VKGPNTSGLKRSANAEMKSMKTDIPIQETADGSERNGVSAGINYVQQIRKVTISNV